MISVPKTHNVAATSSIADFVVSLGLDGRVVSQGSVSDALDKDKNLAVKVAKDIDVKKKANHEIDVTLPMGESKQSDGKLVLAEEVAEGHVSLAASVSVLLS
jgi:hypothetical protein